jgi:hypothetical protein
MQVSAIFSKLRLRSIISVFIVGLSVFLILSGYSPGRIYATTTVSDELVGEWQAKLQFDKGILASYKDLEFMYIFNTGGTLVESGNHDSNAPIPPAYGIWRKTGSQEFEAKYEFYVTEPPKELSVILNGGGWKPVGRGVLSEKIKLSKDGKTYVSKVHVDILTTDGKPMEGGGDATAFGEKLLF